MFRPIAREIKDEILLKIKGGGKAQDLASQYGVSPKTIYTWLSRTVVPEISVVEHNRVKRENEELKRIIGMMALDLSIAKKKKNTF